MKNALKLGGTLIALAVGLDVKRYGGEKTG